MAMHESGQRGFQRAGLVDKRSVGSYQLLLILNDDLAMELTAKLHGFSEPITPEILRRALSDEEEMYFTPSDVAQHGSQDIPLHGLQKCLCELLKDSTRRLPPFRRSGCLRLTLSRHFFCLR